MRHHRFPWLYVFGCLLFGAVSAAVPCASAQSNSTVSPTPAQSNQVNCAQIKSMNDFLGLADTRGELKAEIIALEERIKMLPEEIADAPTQDLLTANTETARKELAALQDKKDKSEKDTFRELNLRNMLSTKIESKEALQKELADKQHELAAKKAALKCVQEQISSKWSPEQDFKLRMSTAFAVLIGLVIAGFFFLSNKDAIIRQAIFSGQTGIQFLTLFSIVIAIILFGITGILGDKELSALLGGLSGFILGRYNKPEEAGNGGQNSPGGGGGGIPTISPAVSNPQPLLPPPGGTSS